MFESNLNDLDYMFYSVFFAHIANTRRSFNFECLFRQSSRDDTLQSPFHYGATLPLQLLHHQVILSYLLHLK